MSIHPPASQFLFGNFTLDLSRASLREGQREVALRPKPFALLVFLVGNPDRVVTKDELLATLWPKVVVTEDSLTRCISEVRSALGASGRDAIRTVSRRGYRFALPVQARHPPAGTTDAPQTLPWPQLLRTNLPDLPGELIGREHDLLALDAVLEGSRVVTLVGPGGVGKSCLAQWLPHQRRARFEHGVAWVDLSGMTEPHLVASGISTALGLHSGSGNPLDALLAALQPLRLLAALDNAEHVIDEVARIVQLVSDAAPGVRLLVTSQTALKVPAETVYRLDTLAVPPAQASLEEATGHGALDLFAQRARAADSRFTLTHDNVGAAIQICRELDGLPLSIQLAAARAYMLGTQMLAGLLSERFRVLTAGQRGAPDRQKTLRAAMHWSHALLATSEQTAFRRLGVFAGGFSLDAAHAVVCDASLDRWDVFEALSGLVERSLVVAAGSDPVRYRLLETPRAFAVEQLLGSGEESSLRQRHAQAYTGVFDAAYADYFAGRQAVARWREPLLADLDNGRAALGWAVEHDPSSAVSLAAALALVASSEWPRERRAFLDAARPSIDGRLTPQLRARWCVEAAFDLGASKPAQARALALDAVHIFRDGDDAIGLYRALAILLYCAPADPDDSQQSEFDELRTIERPHWPAAVRAQGAHAAACWFSARGDFESAIACRRQALALYEQAAFPWQVLVAQANLMDSLLASGRIDDAIATGTALEQRLRGTRQLAALPAARLNLAAALLFRGDVQNARQLALEGWPQAVRLAWQPYWADYLALLAALESRPCSAALLSGFADARYAEDATAREVNEARAALQVQQYLERRLTSLQVRRLQARGAALSNEQVADTAFQTIDADE